MRAGARPAAGVAPHGTIPRGGGSARRAGERPTEVGPETRGDAGAARSSADRWVRPVVLGITLLGFALRLHRLTFQPLWWDEGISVYLAGLDPAALTWAKNLDFDVHPPLYALGLLAWGQLAGLSVFSVRLFTVLTATLCLPLAFQLARRWLGAGPAAVATLLAACSPFLIYYSQEARMYGLVPALALGALLLWTRLVARLDAGRSLGRAAPAWVILSAAGLYAYYYTLWLIVAQAIAGLLGPQPRRRLVVWSGLPALTGLLFAPWVYGLLTTPSDWWGNGVGQAPPHGLGPMLEVTWLALSVGIAVVQPYADLVAGLMLAIAVFGLALGPWRDPPGSRVPGRARWQALLLGVVPVACSFALLQVRDFYFPRLVLPVASIVYTFVAAGLAYFGAHLRALAALLLAVCLVGDAVSLGSAWSTRRTAFAPGDYLTVLETVRTELGPGDTVLCAQSWQCGYALAYLAPARPAIRAVEASWLREGRLEREVEELAAAHRRLWVLTWSPERTWDHLEVERAVGRVLRLALVDQQGDTRAALFAAGGVERFVPASVGLCPADIPFGDAFRLVGYRVEPADRVRAGGSLAVTLAWETVAQPPGDLTVFNQLLTDREQIVAQRDAPPLAPTVHFADGRTGIVPTLPRTGGGPAWSSSTATPSTCRRTRPPARPTSSSGSTIRARASGFRPPVATSPPSPPSTCAGRASTAQAAGLPPGAARPCPGFGRPIGLAIMSTLPISRPTGRRFYGVCSRRARSTTPERSGTRSAAPSRARTPRRVGRISTAWTRSPTALPRAAATPATGSSNQPTSPGRQTAQTPIPNTTPASAQARRSPPRAPRARRASPR